MSIRLWQVKRRMRELASPRRIAYRKNNQTAVVAVAREMVWASCGLSCRNWSPDRSVAWTRRPERQIARTGRKKMEVGPSYDRRMLVHCYAAPLLTHGGNPRL